MLGEVGTKLLMNKKFTLYFRDMERLGEVASSALWVGLCALVFQYLDLVSVFKQGLEYHTFYYAIGFYLVSFWQFIKVTFVLPKKHNIPQITPENYEKYALKEIQLATICGMLGMMTLTFSLFQELHILTPLILMLFFVGLINVIKWF